MNRIVIIARMAKGLTVKEVSKELKIDETLYKEIELGISPMNIEVAASLEAFYTVPAYYFTTYFTNNIQTALNALEKQKEIINGNPDFQNISVPAHTHISIAKMGLDSLIAKQEQILLLIQVKELLAENESLKELYEAVKAKKATQAAIEV